MPLSDFQKKLENDLKKSVKLTLNDNRSTMLSVKWEPNCTKVSLHRFFIDAPQTVFESLACYIKQEDRNISAEVKSFIEENLRRLDYSHLIKKQKLDVVGKTYNLRKLFDEVNEEYFQDKVKLNITWFGSPSQKYSSQVTFGLYHEPLKLIKINRLLDHPDFPKYFVAYVIYHEMLHYVCPSYYDQQGRHRIHNREFKERELLFRHYHKAQEWIEANREGLFSNIKKRKRTCYGRS